MPESELNTSNLAVAFPDFSGYGQDPKAHQPFSPNPFSTSKTADQGSEDGKKARAEKSSSSHHSHARVRDENDDSLVSEGRPPIDLAAKNTRFGGIINPKTRKGLQPHMYKPTPGLVQNTTVTSTGATKPMAVTAHGTLSSIPSGSSQQTVHLPHGPNLTDLFSGTIRQAPQVSVAENRPRASRFASASKQQAPAQPKPEEIPVPVVERDLLRSIDILQDRVFELEKIRAGLEQASSDRDKKNYELTLEIEQIKSGQRSDSALGMTDDSSDRGESRGSAKRQLTIEKNRELSKSSPSMTIAPLIS